MTKQKEIKEGIAKRLYTDWNKDPEYTWETLPEFRKQSYRDWVDEYVFRYEASQGVVIKVDSKEYGIEDNAIEVLGERVIPIDNREFVAVEPLIQE